MIRTLWSVAASVGLVIVVAEPSQAKLVTRVGVGAFGGVNVPIVQDDAATGPLYGFRARLGMSFLTFEPAVTFLQNTDSVHPTVTFEAPDVTSYSFSALFGGSFYGIAGLGWSSINVEDGTEESSEPTYVLGAGAEIPVMRVTVDVSPRLYIIQTADNASRKNVGVLIGVNYYFF